MSHSPVYISLFLIHLSFAAFLLPAQENPVLAPPENAPIITETESVQIRIYTLPLRGILTDDSVLTGLPGRLLSEHSITPEICRLRRNSYTDTLHLVPGKSLRLVEKSPDEDQNIVYIDQELPKNSPVLVGLLNPEIQPDTQKPSLEVFPVSETESPAGYHTFLNGLPHVIEIKLENTTHNLTPGNSLSIKASDKRERIYIKELSENKGRIYTGAVYADESRGQLHIIRSHANSERRMDVISLSGPEQMPK